VTVGQLFPPTTCDGLHTIIQTGVSNGNTPYTLPTSGLITSWSFQDGPSTVSGLELKVARPTSTAHTYAIVAESTAGLQSTNAVSGPYPVAIPVQAGDLIGIYAGSASWCESSIGATSADIEAAVGGDQPPGSTASFLPVPGRRIPVSATLQPTPGITLISPASGSVSGGTTVTIAGHDFAGASAVTFGGVPAMKFSVGSDNAIRATSPPVRSRGPVDLH